MTHSKHASTFSKLFTINTFLAISLHNAPPTDLRNNIGGAYIESKSSDEKLRPAASAAFDIDV